MKIDYKKLSKSKGYISLKKAVLEDVMASRTKCFNTTGCNNKEAACNHRYCNKFKWVIDRAKHYSHVTGIEVSDILDAWEADRSYWTQNYYQDCNQPKITANSKNVLVIDTIDELLERVGKEFMCPRCGGVSTDPYECNSGVIINTSNKGVIPCNWKIYGFFGGLGDSLYVFVKDKCKGESIFMPKNMVKQQPTVKP